MPAASTLVSMTARGLRLLAQRQQCSRAHGSLYDSFEPCASFPPRRFLRYLLQLPLAIPEIPFSSPSAFYRIFSRGAVWFAKTPPVGVSSGDDVTGLSAHYSFQTFQI